MNIESHYFIGRLVHKKISEYLPLKISKINFVSANILADYCTLVWEQPQFYLKSWEYLQDYFDYIANGDLNGRKYNLMPSISYHLGIITHYITDYFTHAHIGEGIGGARHHLQYEDFVDNYRLSIRNELIQQDYSKSLKLVDNTDELKFNFETYMETYRQLPASPDVDLNLAISKSIEICVNLLILRYERLHKLELEMNRNFNRIESEKILLLK